MIILSLFDGMACGYQALKKAGVPVTKYYASEIDKYAIQTAKKNHPDIIHLGDINNWQEWDIETPDLIMGGSPCQGFSFAGKGLAFDDPRSKLFFVMVDIINHYKPRFRFLENVKMKQEYRDIITQHMECEPMQINSALVSAQNRVRYYWFNWDAPMPEDRGILLADILEADGFVDREKSYCVDANYHKGGNLKSCAKGRRQLVFSGNKSKLLSSYSQKCQSHIIKSSRTFGEKALSLCTNSGITSKGVAILREGNTYRKLTVTECERLQGLPDGYTEGVSNTQRYKMLGNGWQGDTIEHLYKYLPWVTAA